MTSVSSSRCFPASFGSVVIVRPASLLLGRVELMTSLNLAGPPTCTMTMEIVLVVSLTARTFGVAMATMRWG